jgi:hypothetical protein
VGFATFLEYSTDVLPRERTMFAYHDAWPQLSLAGLAAPSAYLVSTSTSFMDVDDRRKRQTSTATPAEPGDLPWVLAPGWYDLVDSSGDRCDGIAPFRKQVEQSLPLRVYRGRRVTLRHFAIYHLTCVGDFSREYAQPSS